MRRVVVACADAECVAWSESVNSRNGSIRGSACDASKFRRGQGSAIGRLKIQAAAFPFRQEEVEGGVRAGFALSNTAQEYSRIEVDCSIAGGNDALNRPDAVTNHTGSIAAGNVESHLAHIDGLPLLDADREPAGPKSLPPRDDSVFSAG